MFCGRLQARAIWGSSGVGFSLLDGIAQLLASTRVSLEALVALDVFGEW